MRILAALFVVLASAVPAVATPEQYSRPGGYYAQVKAGSLSKPDDNNLTGCFADSVFVDTNGDGRGECVARQPGS